MISNISTVEITSLLRVGTVEVEVVDDGTTGSDYGLEVATCSAAIVTWLGFVLQHVVCAWMCFFCGGIVHPNKQQVFNKSNAVTSSGLLLMAVMGLLFLAVLHVTHTEMHFGKSELALSKFSSCIMLVAYASYH
ncbi:hypothetical protein OSB04_030623 [Centaurea solstitialis]|uniref:Uncharacterized protein n=1 Tax=Centaurea solstitialis TaxID=347529 RepID=A0AA38W405_9ASTR|nr:hypothetical protein OSB04_030623 [Centaurea solstitialis]